MKINKWFIIIPTIILIILLLGYFIGVPMIKKQIVYQRTIGVQVTINAIIQTVNDQGYVALSNGQEQIVLARSPQLEEQLKK
jgi:hypothetical protein